jgi:CRISPR-associated endonuclease/helicase Cas3
VPWDDKDQDAVDKLKVDKIPSGLIARKLQTYVVQVPVKARELLIHYGHVAFESPTLRGDQFAVLKNEDFYKEELGLLWDDAQYLSIESSIL